nr:hypothetical protein [Tanacetum cinerariifolium]
MQNRGASATNPVSPMYGSTSNPMQSGRENCVEVDGQSSQYGHEYINIDDETVPTQDTNEETSERDIGNNNGEDELKSKPQKTSKVLGDFIVYTAVANFQPVDVDIGIYKPLPLIAPDAKYGANKIREAIANWIMVTQQPFSTMEDGMSVYMMKTANPLFERIIVKLMFETAFQPFSTMEDGMSVYMMKTANPLFERISRPTAKADCFKVYENEKKKLKDLTNAVSNISLTTDCWRSSHQKIEYMVIIRHFIDKN